MDLCFKIDFTYPLSDEEQDDFWDSFIDLLEENRLYYRGGHCKTYFEGCIDYSRSPLNFNDVIELLNRFVKLNQNRIAEIIYNNIA